MASIDELAVAKEHLKWAYRMADIAQHRVRETERWAARMRMQMSTLRETAGPTPSEVRGMVCLTNPG